MLGAGQAHLNVLLSMFCKALNNNPLRCKILGPFYIKGSIRTHIVNGGRYLLNKVKRYNKQKLVLIQWFEMGNDTY